MSEQLQKVRAMQDLREKKDLRETNWYTPYCQTVDD